MGSSRVGPFTRSAWPVAGSFIHPRSSSLIVPEGQDNWLTALHLSSFCSDLFSSSQTHRPFTETPRHLLSTIYKLLHAPLHDQLSPYTRRCPTESGRELTMADWQKSFHFTHTSSISCYTLEKNFKLISRSYRDPHSLHKIFPSVTPTCWRCGSEEVSYLHI